MNTRVLQSRRLLIAVALGIGTMAGAQAGPLSLAGLDYVTYGDGNSYGLQVDGVRFGNTGPGSPYYIDSTPGAIKDLVVVATGASGGQVISNLPGMDDAMSTPSGSGSNFFSGVWTSTLSAFTGFTNGYNPLFFFNNNQTNSGASTNQDIAVWAQISLTGAGQTTKYFDFSNNGAPYGLFTEGGGGVYMGNVGAYTSTGAGPLAGSNAATDYVMSGGAICLTAIGAPVSCSSPFATVGPINNNLGANQAAYAIDAPELDAFLAAWVAGQFRGYTDIHIDLRMGCDPAAGSAGVGSCVGRDANSGFEQLFIGTSTSTVPVSEPGMLGLLGLAALGLAATYRRRN